MSNSSSTRARTTAVHIERILRVATGRIDGILCSHSHPDHSPGAAVLKRLTGAPVLGRAAPDDGHQDETYAPDGSIEDGQVFQATGLRLRALHTPGHASNHVCFLLEPAGWLLTGDHLMSGSTVVILPPDGSMRLYLQSLGRLRTLPLTALLPGHGAAILDPLAEIDRVSAHRSAARSQGHRGIARSVGSPCNARCVAAPGVRRHARRPAPARTLFAARAPAEAARGSERQLGWRHLGMGEGLTRGRGKARRLAGIAVRQASVRLGRHWALRDVTFDLHAGEHWLLFGANGAGKTVLLKLLRGDLWPTPTGRESRQYSFADGEIEAVSRSRRTSTSRTSGPSDRIATTDTSRP